MVISGLTHFDRSQVAVDAVRKAMRCVRRAAVLCVALGLATSVSQAAPLDLDQVTPDFTLDQIAYTYTYSAGVGTLTVTGRTAGYYDPVSFPGDGATALFGRPSPATSSFQLTATLSPAACALGSGCVTSGSFRIFSDVYNDGTGVGTPGYGQLVYDGYEAGNTGVYALGGTLSNFGWSDTSGASGFFEFVYESASGTIPTALGLVNADGGIILRINSASGITDFQNQILTQNWSSASGNANTADVFVPLPAAAWLLASGLFALGGVARRRCSVAA